MPEIAVLEGALLEPLPMTLATEKIQMIRKMVRVTITTASLIAWETLLGMRNWLDFSHFERDAIERQEERAEFRKRDWKRK